MSYNYKEIATFGGHCDDFMLVINSCKRTGRSLTTPSLFNAQNEHSVHTEKIILSMSKLKVSYHLQRYPSNQDMYSARVQAVPMVSIVKGFHCM